MNRNEFYKQLMSEYSFNDERIKSNARKGKYAKQRNLPLFIGVTAAAAVCTVAIGTSAMLLSDNHGVNLIPESDGLAALSANERLQRALEEIEKNADSKELHDVLVTFTSAFSADEVRALLTGYSESIPVKQLYFADGTKAAGEEQVSAAFTAGGSQITGAVINCEGAMMKSLQNDNRVFSVEIVSQSDLEYVAPINTEAAETVEVPSDVTDGDAQQGSVIPTAPDQVLVVTEESGTEQAEPETAEATGEAVSESSETNDTETGEEGSSGSTDAPSSNEAPAESGEIIVPDETPTQPADNNISGENPADSAEVIAPGETPDNSADNNASAQTPADSGNNTVPDNSANNTTPAESTNDPAAETPAETPAEESAPAPAEETAAGIPAGVTLPDKAEKLSYEFSVSGADTAFFISDKYIFAKNADSVMLYEFNGVSHKLAASAVCRDARIVWVSEYGERLIVSGVDANGARNKLLLINAGNPSITDLGAEDTVMDGTLVSAAYNEAGKLLVMNIKENDSYYVCTASLNSNGSTSFLSTCFESDSRVALLAAYENNVFLSVNHGGLTQVFKVDAVNGGSTLIKTYENNPNISKNLAFTHAVIAPPDSAVIGFTEIFDPVTESFVRTDVFNDSVNFGASKHSFCINGTYYTITNGSIVQTDNVSAISKVEYRKGLSSLYQATAYEGSVKITESVYTSKAKNDPLAYGELTDNCSAELRKAANDAIGLTNALALNKCSESGIYNLTTLNSCIDAVFTNSAAAQFRNLCGISTVGALRFDGSALTAVTAADTRLVITSKTETTVAGILYIKAGVIGGKTAFFSKSVSFIYENGTWKLNTILK